jgi:hypothetical protein
LVEQQLGVVGAGEGGFVEETVVVARTFAVVVLLVVVFVRQTL